MLNLWHIIQQYSDWSDEKIEDLMSKGWSAITDWKKLNHCELYETINAGGELIYVVRYPGDEPDDDYPF